MTFRTILLVLLFLAAPLRAEMAQVSLLPGWREPARHVAGLQITLDPGWKTYWRRPGEAGIPPSFDWSGSRNVADIRVVWPVPHVFSQHGLRSIGYDSGVVLPVVVTPRDAARPVELRLAMDLGVCREVCMPVSARVSGVLPATRGAPDARIGAALDRAPLSGGAAGAGPMTCGLSPAPDGAVISLALDLPQPGGREHAVIELSDPRIRVDAPNLERRGDRLSLAARATAPRGMPLSFDREALRLTVFSAGRAVEIRGCR